MITLNDVKQKRILTIMMFLIMVMIIGVLYIDVVHAATSTDITLLKKLRSYGIDSVSNIGIDMLRTIAFGLIKGVGDMMDNLYSMIGTVYKYLSFTTSDMLMNLLNKYSVLYKALFIVSLTFFGIYIIHAKGSMDQLNTVNCLIIIIFVIAAMPFFAQKMTKLTVNSADYVRTQWTQAANSVEVESIASSIMNSNVVDLKKVDKNISGSTINGLSKNKAFNDLRNGTADWKMIDINSTMDYGENDYNSEIWSSKLEMTDNNEYELTNMDSGLLNSYYYRYQIVSWFNIFAELISAAIVLFMVVLKCAMLVWQIGMSMIYTPFVALTDLTTGQRTKEALKNFIVLYATIFLCVALIGVYFTAFGFINEKVTGVFPKVIMHIALAWVTIDGPDVIERITGVDVGFKNAWQKAMGARAVVGMAKDTGRILKKGAQITGKAGRTAGNVIFGKSTVDKTVDKMRDAKNNTVQTATDGKGLVGFGQNAANAMKEKMTPSDSVQGVENNAKAADKDFGKNMTADSSVRNAGDTIMNNDRTMSARPDKKQENLASGIRQPKPMGESRKEQSSNNVTAEPKGKADARNNLQNSQMKTTSTRSNDHMKGQNGNQPKTNITSKQQNTKQQPPQASGPKAQNLKQAPVKGEVSKGQNLNTTKKSDNKIQPNSNGTKTSPVINKPNGVKNANTIINNKNNTTNVKKGPGGTKHLLGRKKKD